MKPRTITATLECTSDHSLAVLRDKTNWEFIGCDPASYQETMIRSVHIAVAQPVPEPKPKRARRGSSVVASTTTRLDT